MLLDGGDRTIVVDSPDFSVDEMVALLDHLVAVEEDGWADAGGIDVG